MSSFGSYRVQALELAENAGQLQAYNSTGNCVVLAGPGSGKTKTLTLKLARMLAEDIEEPRGLACITYNNESARELETRLFGLGLERSRRLFVGTVHSFSLTQIILPYAQSLDLGIPEEFKVATKSQQTAALETAYLKAIGPGNPHDWRDRLHRYRRSILERDSAAWRDTDPMTAGLAENYETELRRRGLIDFEDMPLLALRALRKHQWLRKALVAKFPILAVDEYQDLGKALHSMVLDLCFGAGVRLFAVGDPDQSIYGFAGSDPVLLEQLAARSDVEPVRLKLNYRSGRDIVTASELALGEPRGYETPTSAPQGTVYFHAFTGQYEQQAVDVWNEIFVPLGKRRPNLNFGDIAVLYPAAWIGDAIAGVAQRADVSVIRTDTKSLFPRNSRLLSWIERCAMWCCGGWKTGEPRLSRLESDGVDLFAEAVLDEQSRIGFSRSLVGFLWSNRKLIMPLHEWLDGFDDAVSAPLERFTPRLDDERELLREFRERVGPAGEFSHLTLEAFVGGGVTQNRLNLSSLHSSKGREFEIVVMFGIDEGSLPRKNPSETDLRESRQLLYVGLTRAKSELHIVSSKSRPSRFVNELMDRLQ